MTRGWAEALAYLPIFKDPEFVAGTAASLKPVGDEHFLMHHAHVVLTAGDSIRLTQATAGKGVTPLTH